MSRFAANFAYNVARTGREIARRVANVGAYLPSPRSAAKPDSPLYSVADHDLRDWMLSGTIYNRTRRSCGNLNDILRALGKPCGNDAPPILPYYNPVPAIVGCYANALGGRLGKELKLVTPKGDPLLAKVDDAVSRIWRWSNLDGGLNEFTELLANQGTVGIRVAYQASDDGDGKVYLLFDPPSIIEDFEEDARGNTVWVNLKYTGYEYDASGTEHAVEVDAYFGRDSLSVRVDGVERIPPDDQENTLGVCPYRVARHQKRTGEKWGVHAYEGSELAIHGINWGLSQLDEATARAINETVFMAGAGDAPTEVTLGRLTAMYVKLAQGVPAPELKYIVPQLAIGEAGEAIERNVGLLMVRNPELILNAVKLLSGTSGESLAQVLKKVEALIARARVNYEGALTPSLEIAMSVGIVNGLWDLGTGSGSKDSADRAYDDGQGVIGVRFEDRPLLPETPQGKLASATANTAEQKAKYELAASAKRAGVSQRQAWRDAGMSEDEIEQMEEELGDEDTLPDDEDEEDLEP